MYNMETEFKIFHEMCELTNVDPSIILPLAELKSFKTIDTMSFIEVISILEARRYIKLLDNVIDFSSGRLRKSVGSKNFVQHKSNFRITELGAKKFKNNQF